VDRSDDMRVFAKVVERSSFAGAAARLSIAATKPAPPSVIATAAWRRGIRMRPVGARHRMRPAETEDIVLPRLKNLSTALRTRKGWRANSQHVLPDRGIVRHGGIGRFAAVESACRPDRKHGDEDTKEPSGDDFAAARQPLRRPRR
jgi:hypothetical protein